MNKKNATPVATMNVAQEHAILSKLGAGEQVPQSGGGTGEGNQKKNPCTTQSKPRGWAKRIDTTGGDKNCRGKPNWKGGKRRVRGGGASSGVGRPSTCNPPIDYSRTPLLFEDLVPTKITQKASDIRRKKELQAAKGAFDLEDTLENPPVAVRGEQKLHEKPH